MSNTKGSMLISNANAVGTELVNQLGGTGYTPSEWSDAINLLGISDDDKASALAGITEGTYTGTERGAIKYSNCNAVGSMLNKKFSTDRGFKPVEWESAISKLTPLTEGTVSGDICTIVNGADDVPTKSVKVELSASLDGYSEVEVVNSGKNILLPSNADIAETTQNGIKRSYSLDNQEFTFDGTNTKTDSAWLIFQINASDFALNGLKPDVIYRFSHNLTADLYAQVTYNKSGGGIGSIGYLRGTAGRNASVSFTLPSDFDSLRQFQIGVVNTAMDVNITAHFQIELGSTASAYEPYIQPDTYTANLGRTIHGGEVDIVNGTGTDENGNDFTFTGQEVPTRLGYNAFWSDEGDTEVTYRKDPDIPDPPVQLLNMNNNENNNNEGV